MTKIKRNDSGIVIPYTLPEEYRNLDGASVEFLLENKRSTALVAKGEAVIVDQAAGHLAYTLAEGETLGAGIHIGEFQVTYADGTFISFPRSGYLEVDIQRNIDGGRALESEERIAVKVSLIDEKFDAMTAENAVFKGEVGAKIAAIEDETAEWRESVADDVLTDVYEQVDVDRVSNTEVREARGGEATLGAKIAKVDSQLAQTANVINDVNKASDSILGANDWISDTPVDITVSKSTNNIVIKKIKDVSSNHVHALLDKNIISGKKYRLSITAKTSDPSKQKDFFFRDVNSVNTTFGTTSKFNLTSEFTSGYYDFVATKTSQAIITMSSTTMNLNEELTIADISVKELAFDPNLFSDGELLKNGYNLRDARINFDAQHLSVNKMNEGYIVLKKTSSTSAWVRFELTKPLAIGEYKINIVAKSSLPNGKEKEFFLKDSSNDDSGKTNKFKLNQSYTGYELDLKLTTESLPNLILSTSVFDTNEEVTITKLSVKKINSPNPRDEISLERANKKRFKFTDSGMYLFEPTSSTLNQAGYTSVIQMDNKIKDPIDKFYMYWAGHDGGGIRLSTAPTPLGPWTIYPSEDTPLMSDDYFGQAHHISSPCIVYDEITENFYLFFHRASNGLQPTWRAESKDGINFTNGIEVLPCPDDGSFDGLERSYFRVIYSGGRWLAVYQGRNQQQSSIDPHAHLCFAVSEDLLNWSRLPRPLWRDNCFTKYDDGWRLYRFLGGSPCLLEFNGVVWCFYANGEGNRVISAAPLDLDSYEVTPMKILDAPTWAANGGTAEWPTGIESPNFIEYENKLYMYFNDMDDNSHKRRVGVAIMELREGM